MGGDGGRGGEERDLGGGAIAYRRARNGAIHVRGGAGGIQYFTGGIGAAGRSGNDRHDEEEGGEQEEADGRKTGCLGFPLGAVVLKRHLYKTNIVAIMFYGEVDVLSDEVGSGLIVTVEVAGVDDDEASCLLRTGGGFSCDVDVACSDPFGPELTTERLAESEVTADASAHLPGIDFKTLSSETTQTGWPVILSKIVMPW